MKRAKPDEMGAKAPEKKNKETERVKGHCPLWVWAKPTSKGMQLVDLEQEIQFIYYDDKTCSYKHKQGTIKEFLQTFADYNYLYINHLIYQKKCQFYHQ